MGTATTTPATAGTPMGDEEVRAMIRAFGLVGAAELLSIAPGPNQQEVLAGSPVAMVRHVGRLVDLRRSCPWRTPA